MSGRKLRVYLDACVLGRLSDDHDQVRIAQEAQAVRKILDAIARGQLEWRCSTVVDLEVSRNPDPPKREVAFGAMALALPLLSPSVTDRKRAIELSSLGYGATDALHLAMAEAVAADVLLSTDDRFLRKIAQGIGNPRVPAANPLSWFEETFHGYR